MGANSIGSRFTVTTFGESHGAALGVVIDGCPGNIPFDPELLNAELVRRRPGFEGVVSQRKEIDKPEVLSGVFEGKTLGTPIAILVRNQDARSEDYNEIKNKPRIGHADDVWKIKFSHTDHRGGGRSSGRETVSRVMAGAVARMLLKKINPKLKIIGYANQIGAFKLTPEEEGKFLNSKGTADEYAARFPSSNHEKVKESLKLAQENGESFGGSATIVVCGLAAGLGQPVFHKLKADLAAAVMSVGATTAFEIGIGFAASDANGTQFHTQIHNEGLNVYGGIRGGISTGEDLVIRVAFKPTSSILDVAKRGRHDPCIVIRALPVLEAMVALVLADHVLWARTDQV